MAHIEDVLCPHFTGHVGPVRFVKGHADTDDPDLIDYFTNEGGRYVVDVEVHAPKRPKSKPQPEQDDTPED